MPAPLVVHAPAKAATTTSATTTAALRKKSAILQDASPSNSPMTTAKGTPAPAPQTTPALAKVRVGELYWKQDGPCGWTLGQVVALHGDADADPASCTAKWISIDESSGEARDFADSPPQMLSLAECPLYPANPLFTYVLLSHVCM